MSNIRAARKRQQLNNLVAMVTELARPGYTVVDFCSGTVRHSCSACIFISSTPDHICIRPLLHYSVDEINCIHHTFYFSLDVPMVSGDYMEKYAVRCCCMDEGSGDSLERAALIMIFPDVSCPYYASHWFFFSPTQGHVGIVLAHTLPDCQVRRALVCRK